MEKIKQTIFETLEENIQLFIFDGFPSFCS